jgi:hypothetical protein
MKTITVRLDKDTRDELYADIHHNLLDFVLMEAIFCVCNDFALRPGMLLEASEDPEFYLNDPDIAIASSVETLLDTLKAIDATDGIDTESPMYNVREHQGFIEDKLCLAISSITVANKPLDFMMIYDVLQDPALNRSLTAIGTHLGETVIMSLSGAAAVYL